mmetsp:Transcript_15257/g.43420  ORF Transcript_15257/g.43420 Transcript_15257/m.43420 type:complete len:278 (+) Transcript_15257:5886-6719(+)
MSSGSASSPTTIKPFEAVIIFCMVPASMVDAASTPPVPGFKEAPKVKGRRLASVIQESRPWRSVGDGADSGISLGFSLPHSMATGCSGSLNWQLRWTGPEFDRDMASRTPFDTAASVGRSGVSTEGGNRSASHLTYLPKMPTWSIVWLAPLSRSSAGRSAVSNRRGTSDCDASTTDGKRFATAVPDEVITAQGLPVALPWPSAQNPSDRSSIPGTSRARGCCATANVSGEDLEPGAMQNVLHPQRQSSSTIIWAARIDTFGDDMMRSCVEFLSRFVN